jgi:ubiquinone/menaquinone biosynthesis C-methylase UbiE
MTDHAKKKPFFKVYTPRNIYYEVQYRLTRIFPRNRWVKSSGSHKDITYNPEHSKKVGAFYDRYHQQFLRVYGSVIQAFRTKDVSALLDYQIKAMGLKDGQRLLDAGCGIAAPTIHFAKNKKVTIDAITISEVQFEAARQNIDREELSSQIAVTHGDYHRLTHYFPKNSYDVVYFLESFGHSGDKKRLIDECWELLNSGGLLYIKDLFRRIPLKKEHQKIIDHEIRKINKAYHYEVPELNTILDYVRSKGFILSSLKTIDLKLEDFEDLAISNDFQELTGIAVIDDWDSYVFPVDFFELRCIKPPFDLDSRPDRYFLQNIYHGAETTPQKQGSEHG